MSDWMIWFGLAGVVVIVEMFTGTFYLLMIGFGLVAGGLAALTGAESPIQFAAAALVGSVATVALRRSRWGKIARSDAMRDPNVNLDIGQTVLVDAWTGNESETRTARTLYRGASWDVELERGSQARPGKFVIREIRGNCLIVANNGSNN